MAQHNAAPPGHEPARGDREDLVERGRCSVAITRSLPACALRDTNRPVRPPETSPAFTVPTRPLASAIRPSRGFCLGVGMIPSLFGAHSAHLLLQPCPLFISPSWVLINERKGLSALPNDKLFLNIFVYHLIKTMEAFPGKLLRKLFLCHCAVFQKIT